MLLNLVHLMLFIFVNWTKGFATKKEAMKNKTSNKKFQVRILTRIKGIFPLMEKEMEGVKNVEKTLSLDMVPTCLVL